MNNHPLSYMRRFVKEGYEPIIAGFGPGGARVLEQLGYKEESVANGNSKANKKKVSAKSKLSNEEKQGLAAQLQKYLKEQRPDLTINDMCKVGSTFYFSLHKQKGIFS